MTSKVFYDLIDEISATYHLEKEDVAEAIRTALIKAIQAEDHKGIVNVEFDWDRKTIRLSESFNVVDKEVEGYEYQRGDITLEEALEYRSRVRVGSTIKKDLAFESIGRRGVSRFKQNWTQELIQLQKKQAFDHFKALEGEIITATVEKVIEREGRYFVLFNLGYNTYGTMPIEEGLINEDYDQGKQVRVCITNVAETPKGPKIFVTRAQKEIIKRLFEENVPEVAQGVIEIMGIARDAGNRTKVGIKSNNPNVDAKGACVGMGGARIKQITSSLNGERIDIFDWKDDPVKLIAESLTPATVTAVLTDVETKHCIAIVADDQFSLAIGKAGQNVRLASQVTGWKIDIKSKTKAAEEGIDYTPNVYTL